MNKGYILEMVGSPGAQLLFTGSSWYLFSPLLPKGKLKAILNYWSATETFAIFSLVKTS